MYLTRPSWAAIVALGSVGVIVGVSQLIFIHQRMWFPWLVAVMPIMVALAWSILYNFPSPLRPKAALRAHDQPGRLGVQVPWATPTQQCDDVTGCRAKRESAAALGTLSRCASLAQWQSSGLLIHWFWVRIPGEDEVRSREGRMVT